MGAPDPYPANVWSARSRGDEDEGGPQRAVPVRIRTQVQTLPRPCRPPNTQPVVTCVRLQIGETTHHLRWWSGAYELVTLAIIA